MEDVNGCLKVPLFVYMFMMCCGVKKGINLVLILWILINNWRMGLYFPTHVKQAVWWESHSRLRRFAIYVGHMLPRLLQLAVKYWTSHPGGGWFQQLSSPRIQDRWDSNSCEVEINSCWTFFSCAAEDVLYCVCSSYFGTCGYFRRRLADFSHNFKASAKQPHSRPISRVITAVEHLWKTKKVIKWSV